MLSADTKAVLLADAVMFLCALLLYSFALLLSLLSDNGAVFTATPRKGKGGWHTERES